MKAILLLITLMIIMLSACGSVPGQVPSDFSLVLNWDTGALPPVYHYQYRITIGPGMLGEFVYSPGYIENSTDTWVTSFEVTSSDLQSLYSYLVDNKILRDSWQTGQPLLGGQATGIAITASGKQYRVPSVSEVARSQRDLVEQAIDKIRSYVPQSIWDEMNARQSAYEQENSD